MASSISPPPSLKKRSSYEVVQASSSPTSSIKKGDSTPNVTQGDLVVEEEQAVKFSSLFFRRFYKPIDLDTTATRQSVYDDPDLAPHYWPKKDYENLHRFDPNARWTYREEQVSATSHHLLARTLYILFRLSYGKLIGKSWHGQL